MGMSHADSRITDAGFASEAALLTQAQIVKQARISVRGQAKSSDEQVFWVAERGGSSLTFNKLKVFPNES